MHVVWLKRDLRSTDHRPLYEASLSQEVLVLYIVEDDIISQPDYGANHHHFIADSIQELQQTLLEQYNIQLHVFRGEVTKIFDEIQQQQKIAYIHSHIEVGNMATYRRDKRVKKWCRQQGILWKEYSIYEVIRPNCNRDNWSKKWHEEMEQPCFESPMRQKNRIVVNTISRILEFPLCSELHLGQTALDIQRGGRKQAYAMLESFLYQRGFDYRTQMSSPLTAYDACSRISPHLTYGTMSIREVYRIAIAFSSLLPQDKNRYRRRKSLESFISRLHWRGHFMQKLEDEVQIEFRCMHSAYENIRPCTDEEQKNQMLDAWKKGQTGYPLVDACIRSLRHTGWLNFRMRAMIVSFACYNLWLDWRVIKDWLARQFTDYEPGIHICQLQMQAGVTGINSIRVYNPIKQAKEQDPEGVFIRRWVPELRDVPTEFIHRPYQIPPLMEMMNPMNRHGYPYEIVEFETTSRIAKDRIYSIRKQKEARRESQDVFERHGSRRNSRT
jgi:deoxyribodipyrimidine photo-lyase